MGIEWDLTRATDEELAELRSWVAFHKAARPLLHAGTVVNADHPDPAVRVNGVVSGDRREALFGVVAVGRSLTWPPGRLRLPGLDADRVYTVTVEHPGAGYPGQLSLPAWAARGVTLTGRALAGAGLQVLPLHPEHLYVLRVTAA